MTRPLLTDLDELERRVTPHVQRAIKVIAFGSVYTPAELPRMVAEENPLVMQALREGVILHPTAASESERAV